jgi:AcrR family transcriptional regulator
MPRALGQIDVRKSEAILDAASEVMAERGLAATVEEIARRAGVSKQTVYNHFGGREEIVRALSERRSGLVTAALALPGAVDDPETALRGFARGLLQAAVTPRYLEVMRLTVLHAAEHPDLAQIIFEAGPRASRRRLAEFLEEEHRRGRLDVPDPALAAEFFAGMVLGSLQLQGLLGLGAPDEAEADRRAAEAGAAFMRAYAPSHPPAANA